VTKDGCKEEAIEGSNEGCNDGIVTGEDDGSTEGFDDIGHIMDVVGSLECVLVGENETERIKDGFIEGRLEGLREMEGLYDLILEGEAVNEGWSDPLEDGEAEGIVLGIEDDVGAPERTSDGKKLGFNVGIDESLGTYEGLPLRPVDGTNEW
jgi:hypothetical protein